VDASTLEENIKKKLGHRVCPSLDLIYNLYPK
jgi:hypothetical protein